jgi:4-oxalocrotonate tautomerase
MWGEKNAACHREVVAWQNGTPETRLAEAIAKDITSILHYGDESVSVAIEEVGPEQWIEKVYKPEIKNNLDKLYKKRDIKQDKDRYSHRTTRQA